MESVEKAKGKREPFSGLLQSTKRDSSRGGGKNWYKQIYVPGTTLLQRSNLGLAIFSGMFRFSSHARKKKQMQTGAPEFGLFGRKSGRNSNQPCSFVIGEV